MDLAAIYSARKYLKVKDHTPGSLKLGVNPAILGDPVYKELSSGAQSELPKGILGVDLSVFTMSVTVRYDQAVLPHPLVDELFTTGDDTRGTEILAELEKTMGLNIS